MRKKESGKCGGGDGDWVLCARPLCTSKGGGSNGGLGRGEELKLIYGNIVKETVIPMEIFARCFVRQLCVCVFV